MSISASLRQKTGSLKQTLVVGVGNPLLGDEGIGPHVARKLSRLPMPGDVEILDCGCDLLHLVSRIDKPKKIIVIDAVRAGGRPGQLYRFGLDELGTVQTQTRSAHQLQTVEVLWLLQKICPGLQRCEIVVIGVEPKNMKLSGDLSAPVSESIAELTRWVLEEL